MKSSNTILLTLILLLLSCQKNVIDDKLEEKIIVFNVEELFRLKEKDSKIYDKIIIKDTFCINQTNRALKDFENENITFYLSKFECEFEGMKKFLKSYNIAEHHGVSHGFSHLCYEHTMNEKVYGKFGEKFIDSLMFLAEKDFVINNPDSLYIKDGIDIRTKHLK